MGTSGASTRVRNEHFHNLQTQRETWNSMMFHDTYERFQVCLKMDSNALYGHARVWSDCANCNHANLSLEKARVRQRLLYADIKAVDHV